MDSFDYAAYDISDAQNIVNVSENGNNGVYQNVNYYEIQGIAPDELDNVYRIDIKLKGTETVVRQITYSPFTYINNMYTKYASSDKTEDKNLINVITAMYRYNEAAKAYVQH